MLIDTTTIIHNTFGVYLHQQGMTLNGIGDHISEYAHISYPESWPTTETTKPTAEVRTRINYVIVDGRRYEDVELPGSILTLAQAAQQKKPVEAISPEGAFLPLPQPITAALALAKEHPEEPYPHLQRFYATDQSGLGDAVDEALRGVDENDVKEALVISYSHRLNHHHTTRGRGN